MKTLSAMTAAVVLIALPGCMLQEMRDDLRDTRIGVQQLADLAPELRRSTQALDRSNSQLAEMYREIAATHQALEALRPRVDESNAHMKLASDRLAHLEPMMASLRNLDESLAALRKTIENISKAIPGVDFTKGTPPADRVLQRQEDAKKGRDEPH